jgi:hypothetical protein
MRAPVNLK